MKVEKFLLEHIQCHGITVEQLECETGINLEVRIEEGEELTTEEFVLVCKCLGITPEEVSDQVL